MSEPKRQEQKDSVRKVYKQENSSNNMNKQKTVIALTVLIGIMLFSLVSVSAVNYSDNDGFWEQLFSATGRNANCDVTPCKDGTFSGAQTVTCCSSGSEYDGSSDCLIGVYHENFQGTSPAFECATYPESQFNNCVEYIVTSGSQSINALTVNSPYEVYNCPEGSLSNGGGDPADCNCDFAAPNSNCDSSNTCSASKPICKEVSGDDTCITTSQFGTLCPNGLDGSSTSCECDFDYSSSSWKNQRCTPSKPYCLDKPGSSYDYCSATPSGSAPDNWVYSPNECTGSKPVGCGGTTKRCVATEADCGQDCINTETWCNGACKLPSECISDLLPNGERCNADSECSSDYCYDPGIFEFARCTARENGLCSDNGGTCRGSCNSDEAAIPGICAGTDIICCKSEETAPDSWVGVPMTLSAYDAAMSDAILDSVCTLPGQCSKDINSIIAEEYEDVQANNWTITCVKSNTIKANNFEAFKEFALQQTGTSWDALCGGSSLVGLVGNIMSWFSGIDTCAQIEANTPAGTCRASIKATNEGFCWPAANIWLSPYTKINDCQTNTIILIVVVLLGALALMRFAG